MRMVLTIVSAREKISYLPVAYNRVRKRKKISCLPVGREAAEGGATIPTTFVMYTVASEGVPMLYAMSAVIDISNTSSPSSTESVVAANVICPDGLAIIAGEAVTRV